MRRDTVDARARKISTELHSWSTGDDKLTLSFVRDDAGALQEIRRQRGAGPETVADTTTQDPTVTPADLQRVPPWTPRRDVLLALGAPKNHTDERLGVARWISDSWLSCGSGSPGSATSVDYDAEGRVTGYRSDCPYIEDWYCVSAGVSLSAEAVIGTDEHWTAGPWVRLDGELDVTAEHRLITPGGPRPAGELAPGDAVLAADGSVRTLRSVEILPPGPERLGVNLRTESGTFGAAGFLLESEPLCPCCPPPHRR